MLMLSGCGAGGDEDREAATPSPAALAVRGVFETPGTKPLSGGCLPLAGFRDIEEGTQVVVTSGSGETLGLGTLSAPTYSVRNPGSSVRLGKCSYDFSVPNVSSGQQFYRVEVGRRGVQQYSQADITQPLTLQLGL